MYDLLTNVCPYALCKYNVTCNQQASKSRGTGLNSICKIITMVTKKPESVTVTMITKKS